MTQTTEQSVSTDHKAWWAIISCGQTTSHTNKATHMRTGKCIIKGVPVPFFPLLSSSLLVTTLCVTHNCFRRFTVWFFRDNWEASASALFASYSSYVGKRITKYYFNYLIVLCGSASTRSLIFLLSVFYKQAGKKADSPMRLRHLLYESRREEDAKASLYTLPYMI